MEAKKDNNKASGQIGVVVERNLWHTCVNTSRTSLFCWHSSSAEWPHWLLPCLCLGGMWLWFLVAIARCNNTQCVYRFNKAFSVSLLSPKSLSVCKLLYFFFLGRAAADQVALGHAGWFRSGGWVGRGGGGQPYHHHLGAERWGEGQ